MAVVGSLDAGLFGEYDTLIAKSMLDGVSALLMATTLGIGVMLSAATVLVYQGGIALLAGLVAPALSDARGAYVGRGRTADCRAGTQHAGREPIRVGNLLPAVFLPIIYVPVVEWASALLGLA